MTKMQGSVALTLVLLTASPALGATHDLKAFDALSLEQLLQVEITSVSRKSESRREAAAAVYVLTGDDLKRSGARSIPDALRSVPGVHVAQIDANKWAVSVRGFNGRFANKLLVLMDGRPLYNPYFSGVFWDAQNIPFDEIERIEVIRGPGATLWGSNAVNGIINIITRSARDTHGWKVEGEAGSRNGHGLSLRYGGVSENGWHHRVHASHRANDNASNVLSDDDDDTWQDSRVGVRLDRRVSDKTAVTLQAQAYRGASREALRLLGAEPFRVDTVADDLDTSGGWLSAAWEHVRDDGTGYKVHGFVENAKRDTAWFQIDRWTASLGFDQRFRLGERHDLVWGFGASISDLPLEDRTGIRILELVNDERYATYELFVQDEIHLSHSVRLILGSKFEDHEYTGFSAQPNIRLAWSPSDRLNLWAAVSKAERTPSRGESHFRTFAPVVIPPLTTENPSPVPGLVAIEGSPDFAAEEVTAYEVGLRYAPSSRWEFDLAVFRNDYDNVIASVFSTPVCWPSETPVPTDPLCVVTSQAVLQPVSVVNLDSPKSRGFEVAISHQALDNLYLSGNASFFEEMGNSFSATQFGGDSAPRRLMNVEADWRMSEKTSVNVALRYVDDIALYGIDSYLTMDLRFGWRFRPDVRFELVGRNLLDDKHQEFTSELGESLAAEIRSSIFARLTWAP